MSHRRAIRQHWTFLGIIYHLLDALGILLGFLAATKWFAAPDYYDTFLWAAVAVAAFYVIAEAVGTYRDWQGSGAGREFGCVFINWTITLVALVLAGAILEREDSLPFYVLAAWLPSSLAALLGLRGLTRAILAFLRSRGFNTRNCAIVGVNPLGFQLARGLNGAAAMGVKVVGFFDDREDERLPEIPSDIELRLGNIDTLMAKIHSGEISTVYMTLPMRAEDRLKGILARLADTTASVYIVPDFFVFELLHSRWTSISGLPAVSVFEHPFFGIDGFAKRLLDLAVATCALLLAALPMAIIALLIRLESSGPIFFLQERYGLDGRRFWVWKFRSMRMQANTSVVKQATKGDARVTRLGAILRKTSLDELPQLFNVLRGDMSVVGPRPHASIHNEEYRQLIQGYMLRHKVKPGITGLAQVNGFRGETDTLDKMAKRVACDHQYIRDWSLWLDLKILFRTIWIVASCKNAY